ncbi:cyclic nucleotide-binding domain-containing protein [Actinomadura sp.]|uniref:cyclic nucleotide-binding domain-containing protein n=1 Tax=Actinomadura sp. TaxID=1989 RepID=UPI0037CBD1D3
MDEHARRHDPDQIGRQETHAVRPRPPHDDDPPRNAGLANAHAAPAAAAAPAAPTGPRGGAARRPGFWPALTTIERAEFLATAEEVGYPAGAVLWEEGQAADHTIVIKSGSVRVCVVRDGRERIIAFRGPGDIIGERAALMLRRRSATIVAMEPLHALRLTTQQFVTYLSNHPRVVAVLEREMYERLTEQSGSMQDAGTGGTGPYGNPYSYGPAVHNGSHQAYAMAYVPIPPVWPYAPYAAPVPAPAQYAAADPYATSGTYGTSAPYLAAGSDAAPGPYPASTPYPVDSPYATPTPYPADGPYAASGAHATAHPHRAAGRARATVPPTAAGEPGAVRASTHGVPRPRRATARRRAAAPHGAADPRAATTRSAAATPPPIGGRTRMEEAYDASWRPEPAAAVRVPSHAPPTQPMAIARPSWAGQNCTVVFTDIAGFSSRVRDETDRIEVRRVMYAALRESFQESGVPWDACHSEDRGDGALIVVPPEIPTAAVVDPMIAALGMRLRRHNHRSSAAVRVQLRVALDVGPVMPDPPGMSGWTIINAARLLDAAPLKERLAATGADLGVIASRFVYDSVIAHGPGYVNAAEYEPIGCRVKETDIEGWIHLRGLPARSAL